MIKNLPARRRKSRESSIPGEGVATHSSILAWRIPWTEEPGGPQSMGPQSQTRLSSLAHTLSCLLFQQLVHFSSWFLLQYLTPGLAYVRSAEPSRIQRHRVPSCTHMLLCPSAHGYCTASLHLVFVLPDTSLSLSCFILRAAARINLDFTVVHLLYPRGQQLSPDSFALA